MKAAKRFKFSYPPEVPIWMLIDACTPRALRQFLANDSVSAAQEMNWGTFKNGDLLGEAEVKFDVLISTDQNLKDQQKS
jgi:hypothetical protein